MKDEEKINQIGTLGLKLTTTIFDFFKESNLSKEESFIIMSEAISFFLGHFGYHIFKKGTDIKIINEYIDNLCEDSKEKLSYFLSRLK
jgi:hypothetical protein